MINEDKLSRWKKLIALVVIALIFILGMLFLNNYRSKNSNGLGHSDYQKMEVINVNPSDFLKAYYTKERVGQNQKKYKPYMTSQAYNQQKARENNPSDKQYTDYMKDFEFQSAKYYFSKDAPVVFASVKYDFTAMSYNDVALVKTKKNQPKTKRIENKTDLKLTYKKEGNKWLVDKMEIVDLNTIE